MTTDTIQGMLTTHPKPSSIDAALLASCIAACFECAQACTSCADACLAERSHEGLQRCIRLNQDCADICKATGSILSRQSAFEPAMAQSILQACISACVLCGEECEGHAKHMKHCRICADACHRCEAACKELVASLTE